MILSAHHQNRIRNLGMSAVYRIAADEGVSVSDVLDLMVTAPFTPSEPRPAKPEGQAQSDAVFDSANEQSRSTSLPGAEGAADREQFTPSQPGDTSRSHALAADTPVPVAGVPTDGAAEPPVPTAPSVDLSGLAAHEQGPVPSPSPMANAPEPESRSTRSRQPGSGDFLPIGKRKEARERVQAVFDAHPDWTPSQIAAEARVHVSTAREWIRQMKACAVVEAAAEPEDREAKLRAMFENGQPTATEAANALGYIGQGGVRKLAKRLGLEFRPVSKAEVADRIRSGMQHTAVRTAKAQTTEALRRATAKPQEAVEPPPAPEARPEPEQPPATKPVAPRPVTAPNEPRRIVPTHAPVGAGPSTRFYVRDMKGRYLHQSLERSPTDNGPLMTSNRKWAWYDNAQRFAGACRKWPEIADMRKELPNA
jgi:hypothetical protein